MEERFARSHRIAWAVAKDVLRCVFGPNADIGRVTKIGEGLSHDVFVAYVECPQPNQQDSGSYTVSLPGRHADSPQHARPNLQPLLASVAAQVKSIRVPSMTRIATASPLVSTAVARSSTSTTEAGKASVSPFGPTTDSRSAAEDRTREAVGGSSCGSFAPK